MKAIFSRWRAFFVTPQTHSLGGSGLALGNTTPVATRADPREARATQHMGRFLGLVVQLLLLFAVIVLFRLESRTYYILTMLAFAGFMVHYWLPFAWKEPFWIALSLAGAFVILLPETAVLLLAVGGVCFGIMRCPLAYRYRVALIALIGGVAAYGRVRFDTQFPFDFWPVFGSVFMFRMIIYLYDLQHERGAPSLREYLRYFFILPNYYFLLFPVIDFQTLRRSYYQRDIHDTAQQGILWMVRGTTQLILYRIFEYWNNSRLPENVVTFSGLVTTLILTYLLYLRVSGTFHIICGMLHLFGYNLPETHRRYLLASSLTDFWRRINIFWKDFMVKTVYFPIYFRLRKQGDVRAQVIATAGVFLMTWALHSCQYFWLRGELLVTWPDTLFWAILGLLVIGNLLWELRHAKQPASSGWRGRLMQVGQVIGMFVLITVLWSLWQAPSVHAWLDLLTWWRPGI